MSDDKQRDKLQRQVKKRRSGPIRRTKGTVTRKVGEPLAICGWCLNTGIVDLREGGVRRCRCGQDVLR